MFGTFILALLLLALFGAGAWALWRFGGTVVHNERHRGIAAGVTGGIGVLVAALVFFGGFESRTASEFVVTTELNQGAVSFPFFIKDADVQHELQIRPQREAGQQPQGPVKLRVILTGPDNVTLINEAVTIASAEMDITSAEGVTARGIDWVAWSKNFAPTAPGFYEIALSLPPRAPRVRLRVGEPQRAGE